MGLVHKQHGSILTRVIAKLCRRDTLSIAAKYGYS